VATPAPVQAPATQQQQHQQQQQQVTTTPAAATSVATAAPTAAQEPVRLEYQTLTVEQIMNKFQRELEQDAVAYVEQAKRVAEYDAVLRDSQRDISKLISQTHRVMLQQEEVERTLTGIGAFQTELDSTLDGLENDVDALFGAAEHLSPVDADVERESAYTNAILVEQRLQMLTAQLQDTLGKMAEKQESMLSGDVGKVVQILNQHQNSLTELEVASRQMENDISHVGRILSQH
jgi:nuclear pore complex protein Nup62